MKINNYCGPLKKIRLNLLFIILVCFLISCGMIIATIPLHEGAHWVMSEIDPYIKPVELHLFDDTSFQNGEKVLSSALGCVIVKEAYPGAFLDRPSIKSFFVNFRFFFYWRLFFFNIRFFDIKIACFEEKHN